MKSREPVFSFIVPRSSFIVKKRWALGDAHQFRRNSFEAPFARKTTPAFLASLCKTFQIIGRLQKALSRNSCCNCCHYERQADCNWNPITLALRVRSQGLGYGRLWRKRHRSALGQLYGCLNKSRTGLRRGTALLQAVCDLGNRPSILCARN